MRSEVSAGRNRRLRIVVGAILLGGLVIQCQRAMSGRPDEPSKSASPLVVAVPDAKLAYASPAPELPRRVESPAERAAHDPLGFFEEAIERYDRTVRDYTCVFTKQELVGAKLSKEQVMNAMFREKPFSVRLEWTKNADKCDRVLYVADRWVNKDGQQLAVVEPGWLARTFVSHVMRPINGPDAQKSSRRTVDQFGLRNSLALVVKFSKLAMEKNVAGYSFSFQGTSEVNQRPTLVFQRHLPYTDEQGLWPDRTLVVHLDKELLVPVLCLSYADDAKQILLGKYMITDVKLNINLPDSVFTKEGMGL